MTSTSCGIGPRPIVVRASRPQDAAAVCRPSTFPLRADARTTICPLLQVKVTAPGTATNTATGHADSAPHRGAGFDIVPAALPGDATRPAQCHPRAPPGGAMKASLRRGRRPPASHRRGRRPSNRPMSDHADGTTLGRRRRTRRPGSTESASGTTATTKTRKRVLPSRLRRRARPAAAALPRSRFRGGRRAP